MPSVNNWIEKHKMADRLAITAHALYNISGKDVTPDEALKVLTSIPRGAFLHMMADAAVSAVVVLSGGLILWTGWRWLDPLLSLGIVIVIVVGTWGLFRDAVRMSLDAVPRGVDLGAVSGYLDSCPGVSEVHDLHVWSLSTTETALTAHLVMPNGPPGDRFLDSVAHALRERFSIGHATLQLEAGRCEQGCGPARA